MIFRKSVAVKAMLFFFCANIWWGVDFMLTLYAETNDIVNDE